MSAPSLLALLRLFLREIDSPAVEVAPWLSPQRVANARAFADYGEETPLALLDDTRDGTGEEGVLVTEAACYCSKPRVRVAVDQVRGVPEYPDGPRRPGIVPTAAGPITLPLLKVSAARDALHRAFNALSMANGGPTDLALPVPPSSETPVGALVRKHLVHRDIAFRSELSPTVVCSIVLATSPLDALSGEQIFALVDESGTKGTEGIVVTDRRLVYRRREERLSIPYETVEQVGVSVGASEGVLEVVAQGQSTSLSLARRRKALPVLAAFLDDMARSVAPVWRHAPVVVEPTPADPAGVASAMALLDEIDPRPRALGLLVGDALRSGSMRLDVAQDYVQNVLLLHHGLGMGRSMYEGWWLSPLEPPDLLFLLRRLLGRPYQESAVGEGQSLAIKFDPRRAEQWMASIAASTLGQSVTAVFGAGALRARPPQITALRVEVHPAGPRSLLGITAATEGRRTALDEIAGPVFAGLDRQLAELEARMLLIRIAMGPAFRAPELWDTPPSTLRSRITELGGDPAAVTLFEAATRWASTPPPPNR